MSAAIKRPIGRWHGGKFKLGSWVVAHLPHHQRYVEPFGGMASVLLLKPRSFAEIYNDLDGDVVNLFRVLRDEALSKQLQRAVSLTPYSREEFGQAYEPTDDMVERARRLLVRSHMGHGSDAATGHHKGGFRSNVSRRWTIPSHDWANYAPLVRQFCERLRGVVVEHDTAEKVIDRYDSPQTLFYIDPPYVMDTRSEQAHRTAPYRHELNDAEHVALLGTLKTVKGMVVISGYDSSLYQSAIGNWKQIRKETRDGVNNAKTEVLWLNAAAANQQMRLV